MKITPQMLDNFCVSFYGHNMRDEDVAVWRDERNRVLRALKAALAPTNHPVSPDPFDSNWTTVEEFANTFCAEDHFVPDDDPDTDLNQ